MPSSLLGKEFCARSCYGYSRYLFDLCVASLIQLLVLFLQVGVISWGTYDPCRQKKKQKNSEPGEIIREPPPRGHKPRDFYISLFGVQDWLRRHLAGSLRFIPKQ